MPSRIKLVDTATFELSMPDIPLFTPEKARAVVETIERDYLELALLDVAGHVAEAAPRNLGLLAQSFQAVPAGATGGIEILGTRAMSGLTGRVFSSLPYAIVMERGRTAGQPISRAGVAAIGLWVRRKLGLSGREAHQAMYAIAWTIRKRGIPGKHYAERGFHTAEPRVEALWRTMNEAIAKGLTGGPPRG